MDLLVENIIGVVLVMLGLGAMILSAYLKDPSLKDAGFGVLSAGLLAIKAPSAEIKKTGTP